MYASPSQFLALALFFTIAAAPASALAEDRGERLAQNAEQALDSLMERNAAARAIGEEAVGVLVFPNIVKAGLVFGGAYGEGVLRQGGDVTGYFNSVTASWGFQAGAQTYSYIVFLMNDEAVDYLDRSQGWEIGVGPSLVVVNEGMARNLSTSTLKEDAYAFIFDQQGAMAALSIEGTKISRIER